MSTDLPRPTTGGSFVYDPVREVFVPFDAEGKVMATDVEAAILADRERVRLEEEAKVAAEAAARAEIEAAERQAAETANAPAEPEAPPKPRRKKWLEREPAADVETPAEPPALNETPTEAGREE